VFSLLAFWMGGAGSVEADTSAIVDWVGADSEGDTWVGEDQG
jgi:hypothetical protein